MHDSGTVFGEVEVELFAIKKQLLRRKKISVEWLFLV